MGKKQSLFCRLQKGHQLVRADALANSSVHQTIFARRHIYSVKLLLWGKSALLNANEKEDRGDIRKHTLQSQGDNEKEDRGDIRKHILQSQGDNEQKGH